MAVEGHERPLALLCFTAADAAAWTAAFNNTADDSGAGGASSPGLTTATLSAEAWDRVRFELSENARRAEPGGGDDGGGLDYSGAAVGAGGAAAMAPIAEEGLDDVGGGGGDDGGGEGGGAGSQSPGAAAKALLEASASRAGRVNEFYFHSMAAEDAKKQGGGAPKRRGTAEELCNEAVRLPLPSAISFSRMIHCRFPPLGMRARGRLGSEAEMGLFSSSSLLFFLFC